MRQWYFQGYVTDVLEVRFAGPTQTGPIQTPFFRLCDWFMHGRSAFLLQIPEQYHHAAQQALQAQQQQQQQQQLFQIPGFPPHFPPFGNPPIPGAADTGLGLPNQQPMIPVPTSFLQAVGGDYFQGQNGFNQNQFQNDLGLIRHDNHDGNCDDDGHNNNNDDKCEEEYNDPFNDTLGYIPDDDIDDIFDTHNSHLSRLSYTASFHKQAAAHHTPEAEIVPTANVPSVVPVFAAPLPANQGKPQATTPATKLVAEEVIPAVKKPISEITFGWGPVPIAAPTKSFSEIQREQANEEQQKRDKPQKFAEVISTPIPVPKTTVEVPVPEKTPAVVPVPPTPASAVVPTTSTAVPETDELSTKSGWGVIPQNQSVLSFENPKSTKSQKSSTGGVEPIAASGWAKLVAGPAIIPATPLPPPENNGSGPVTVTSRPQATLLSSATVSTKAAQSMKSTPQANAWGKPVAEAAVPTPTPTPTPAPTPTPVQKTSSGTPIKKQTEPLPVPVPVPAPVKEEPAVETKSKAMSSDFRKWFGDELKKLVGSTDISSFEWVWDVEDNQICKEMLIDAFGNKTFALDFVRFREADKKNSIIPGQPKEAQNSKKQPVWTTIDGGNAAAKSAAQSGSTPNKKQQQINAVQNNAFAALTTTKLSNQQITQSKKRK